MSIRLAFKVSDDMATKIESYAQSFGMSKSSFIAYCVGSHVRTLEQQDGLISSVGDNINKKVDDIASEQKGDDQTFNETYF